MTQFSLFDSESRIWSVAELTRYVRQTLESDYRLQDLWVTGEAFNVSRPSSGHLYFTLKDAQASLRCVMWRSEVVRQTALPRDGEAIEVHGSLSVYEAGGQYQLYADTIRRAGEGELFKQFMRLKTRLEAEGLFDSERKRPLPAWPRRIGVVTSPTGAALRDVLHVLQRRFPMVILILAPTPVQGEDAPPGIVAALQALNQYGQPDVILLVRGGGSIEDLWAFNDESVARAIAASAAPVVSGIGHETDIVIADFVADVRAPTPSAAGELATPDRKVLAQIIIDERIDLGRLFGDRLLGLRTNLTTVQAALHLASPRARVAGERQRLDVLSSLASTALRHSLALRRAAVGGAIHTLEAVGPSAVLSRGYAVVKRTADGAVVRSVNQVAEKDELNVRVSDGTFDAQVTSGRGERSSSGTH
ncbi:MAG: exodeoxyribonuclease VII large subunit [Anaerolineales bacterium]|nr:exodeoxyribonuclease VII large subunit [Anaerolineales bacterium]